MYDAAINHWNKTSPKLISLSEGGSRGRTLMVEHIMLITTQELQHGRDHSLYLQGE